MCSWVVIKIYGKLISFFIKTSCATICFINENFIFKIFIWKGILFLISQFKLLKQKKNFKIYRKDKRVSRMVWSFGLFLPFLLIAIFFEIPSFKSSKQSNPEWLWPLLDSILASTSCSDVQSPGCKIRLRVGIGMHHIKNKFQWKLQYKIQNGSPQKLSKTSKGYDLRIGA